VTPGLDAPSRDRTALWLPLLRRLTEVSPRWVVWKNADAALAGHGDVDAAAPIADWEAMVREFRTWASEHGLGPVIECRHPPRTMFLLAVDRDRRELVELDVLARKYFRGWTLFRAEDLPPLAVEDPRGFRVLRPGAQALIQLAGNLRWGGRPDGPGLRRRGMAELFALDPDGALRAAAAFGLPSRTVARAAEAVAAGRGGRGALLALEGTALARAVADPGILARRIRFRLWTKRRCPALRAVFEADRMLPPDVDTWLAGVRRTHRVHPDAAGPARG
jgi:hypothetical protein